MNDIEGFLNFNFEVIKHKTTAIKETMTSVPGYPKKLKIFLTNASPYWQARYYEYGRMYRKTCKTENKIEAFRNAIEFYERLILKKYQHPSHLSRHLISEQNRPEKTHQSELSFKIVSMQWIKRKEIKWTPRHKLMVEKRLENNIYKYVGNKLIQKIGRKELITIIQKIEARGANDVARRTLNDFKQIWHFAMLMGICRDDITIGLNSILHGHTVIHQSAISEEELPKLMVDIKQYSKEGDEITKFALQLIAITFVRKNELLLSKWNEFDLEKGIWKIPAERMKMRIEHTVPLSMQAIAILKHVKNRYPSENFVFHINNPDKPIRDNALIQALYWLGYKGKMTVHGFRAVASTILNENGFRSDVIEKQLAHSESNQSRRAYNRAQYIPERKNMMNWWSDYLAKLTTFVS